MSIGEQALQRLANLIDTRPDYDRLRFRSVYQGNVVATVVYDRLFDYVLINDEMYQEPELACQALNDALVEMKRQQAQQRLFNLCVKAMEARIS